MTLVISIMLLVSCIDSLVARAVRVLYSLQNDKFSLTTGGDIETVHLPNITRPANEERIKLPGNEKVKKVISTISDRHVSVFSYAIMSGRTDAVEAINDLVLRIFSKEDESSEVRLVSET